jgi:hypothetical protein
MTPPKPPSPDTQLTDAERSFEQWMDNLDLEEVNLLGEPSETVGDDFGEERSPPPVATAWTAGRPGGRGPGE